MITRRGLVLSMLLIAAAVAIWWMSRAEVHAPARSPSSESPPAPPPTSPRGGSPVPTSSRESAEIVARPSAAREGVEAAWRVTGLVLTPDGRPVNAARVRLSMEAGGVDRVVASAVSDHAGRYEADASSLRPLPAAVRGVARLAGRATAPLHRPGDAVLRELPWDPVDSIDLRLDIVLEPGATLSGGTVDGDGQPVAGAYVTLHPASGGTRAREAYSGEDGAYWFPIDGPGSFRLAARADQVGVAFAGPVALDPSRDAVAPDLVLSGPGVIDGSVRRPDGRPVPAVRVTAVPDPEATYSPAWDLSDDLEGLPSSAAATDAAGRFRFTGLHPGRYFLRPGESRESPPVAAETGERDVVLILEEHRLVVFVRDEADHPVPGAGVGIIEMLDQERIGSMGAVAWGPLAQATYEPRPGSEVLAEASARGGLAAEASVRIRERDYDTTLILVLRPPDKKDHGRVRVSLTGPDGAPITQLLASLYAVPSESTRFRDARPDAEGRLPLVPPGRYRLEVAPGRTAPLLEIEPYFPITRMVDVVAREETHVTLAARAGGRLRLTVHFPEGVEPTTLKAELRPEGGGPAIHPGIYVTVDDDGHATSTAITPGKPNVCSRVLEPGNYVLRLEAKGCQPLETHVFFDAGRTTDVEARLHHP